jgi:hypothetical protein
MSYCIICHKEDCDCTHDILERIDQAKTVLAVSDFNIRILRRDRFELIEALKQLIETCPADPDSTDKFLDANHRAVELISRIESQTKQQ